MMPKTVSPICGACNGYKSMLSLFPNLDRVLDSSGKTKVPYESRVMYLKHIDIYPLSKNKNS